MSGRVLVVGVLAWAVAAPGVLAIEGAPSVPGSTAPAPAAGGDAKPPAFSVLVVEDGDNETYEALPQEQAVARRKEIRKGAEKALADWKAASDAFFRDPANRGRECPQLRPEPVRVSIKDFPGEEQARRFAEEKGKPRYAVVVVKGADGGIAHKIVAHAEIRKLKEESHAGYLEAHDAWEKARDAWYKKPGAVRGMQIGGALTGSVQPFPTPEPQKPSVDVIQKGFSSKKEAKATLAKPETKKP